MAKLDPKEVLGILAEGDRRCREIAHKVWGKALQVQFEAIDKKFEELKSVRVVSDEERSEEPLALPMFNAGYDRIIDDAHAGLRKMPLLFGKPATELSKRELLVLAILQADSMSSYVSKEGF